MILNIDRLKLPRIVLRKPDLIRLVRKLGLTINYRIRAVEYYLPEKVITNEFLSRECGIDAAFLNDKVGISERRVAAEDEPTSALAIKAGRLLFERNRINPKDVTLLLICTQNPDYRLPTTACLVQDSLNLPRSCIAFDVNLGCSGFVYAMAIAGNFIRTGMTEKALIIMADEYSKIIDSKDKNTASLFGDAASAVLLEASDGRTGVLDCTFGTDGSGADLLILRNSGVVLKPHRSKWLTMNGRKVMEFSQTEVPRSVREILAANKLKTADIRFFIFHQANRHMLRKIQKILSIPDDKMVIDMQNTGNTVSSTIPIAYKNLLDRRELKKDDLIIFTGFGVGLSWGSILYRYA